MKNFKKLALKVITIEQQAIAELEQFIDHNFEQACQLMFACKGELLLLVWVNQAISAVK